MNEIPAGLQPLDALLRKVLTSAVQPGTTYHYRLEWDIIGEPAIPGMSHMTQDFTDEQLYRETRGLLDEAEKRGMLANLTVAHRAVVVSGWAEGLPS